MIWWQAECHFGDMIRISFGQFYHYGIFVSEEEVIQFGLPPTEGLLNRATEDIAVCITDIDTFSGGKVVEVATTEKTDKKRLSPKKTVKRAREAVGEKGYHILHNNCEHFVRYCYFGEKRCEVTEQVQTFWQNKYRLDLYFAPVLPLPSVFDLSPKVLYREVTSLADTEKKAQAYAGWKLLEYALYRTFGYKIEDLNLKKQKDGKYSLDKCYFSLSHTSEYVAVAVSSEPIGVALERLDEYASVWQEQAPAIIAQGEPCPTSLEEFVMLRAKKQSIHHYHGQGAFAPCHIVAESIPTLTLKATLGDCAFLCCLSGKRVEKGGIYLSDGTSATRYREGLWI